MPLPGGASSKFGDRYEGRWTVFCITDVMDERANSIRLEPPGIEGEGVEFWMRRGPVLEYHQVKRQQSGLGRWTLADLAGKGVLTHFWQKLDDINSHCFFVSTHSAYQLDELSDRARRSASWEEFKREFLKDIQNSTDFAQLCSYWGNCDQEAAYERLQRVYVRTIDEDILTTSTDGRLASLVEGDAPTIRDVLAQFLLDKVHIELKAVDIWRHLENRSTPFRRRRWGSDPHVLAAVDEINKRYISSLQDELIAGKLIPREEVQTAIDELTPSSGVRGILLVGEAGVGKSSVMSQVAGTLYSLGWPILAIRVDRLEPTPLPDRVGQQLNLPGSPANVLASVADGKDCALIIDQLDAVSLASGRHPDFFECINEIIKQARVHPRMRIVLGCRKFDLENDHRLRSLTGDKGMVESISIGRLSPPAVKQAIEAVGLSAGRLNTKQLELLSIPLHLKLLVEIALDSDNDAFGFETVNDLYAHFWEHKQSLIRNRGNHPVHWASVIDKLCDYMSQQQVLSAPKEILGDYEYDANLMVSEHVVIADGKRYAFFHEGFFDYAFARRFAARGLELLPLLKSSEQHLFRRAQVRQILLHERDDARDHYLSDIIVLLTDPDVRFHIKKVVFALLAQLVDPTEQEWQIIEPLISEEDDLSTREVLQILNRSVPWFQLLDSLGLIERWLADKKEKTVNRAVLLLSAMQRMLPDRVAELVEPYVGVSEDWNNRLVYIVQWANLHSGRRFLDLFLRLLDEGILDGARGLVAVNSDFWSLTYTLSKERPGWCCEVIGHYFKRRSVLSIAAGQPNPFDNAIPESQSDDQIFMASAEGAPEEFIKQVMPFMIEVVERIANRDKLPWTDSVWGYRFKGQSYRIGDALLSAMETALSNLAVKYPQTFETIAKDLRELNFETVQFLLIRAYAANGSRFADDAVDYLCTLSARLEIGYLNGGDYWAARELVVAISPHCSDDNLERLENLILNYYPEWERKAQGRHGRGLLQLILLGAIDPNRRSLRATRRLEEWQRKFPDYVVEPPSLSIAEDVGPPITESAAKKMTNEQWLKAIKRYQDDEHHHRDGHFVGGARELSRLLQGQVKNDPARFSELMFKFPEGTNWFYFNAILQGIAESDIDINLALRVCAYCHDLPNRPFGNAICRVIKKFAEQPLPVEALDMVAWYAINDPDPVKELWRTEASRGQPYYGGDLYTAAINSIRGSSAETMASLLFADSNRMPYLLPSIERMIQDPSIAVRSCVAAVLIACLNSDRESAVDLFKQLCETEDVLLKTPYIEQFLYYALQTHFEALQPILERMMSSSLSSVVAVGARQSCLASLMIEEAKPFAVRCLQGTESQRIGAAQIFVANLRSARFRSFCEESLIQLFEDQSESVRKEAARCFIGFEGEQLGEYIELIRSFTESPAFEDEYELLIHALEEATTKLPDVVCIVCERFLDVGGKDAADIRTRSAYEAEKVSQLLIRVYSQSSDQITRRRCLDLLDRMMRLGTYGLDDVLASYDR